MEELLRFFSQLQPFTLLSILLLFSALEYIFPPTPGDTAMLLGSTLAGTRLLPVLPTLLFMIAGSCLGGIAAYHLGRKVGRPVLDTFLFKYLGSRRSRMTEKMFRNHAGLVLCGNRFLPGIRGIMLPLAGILAHPPGRAFSAMALSNVIWCGFIFTIGYIFGDNIETTRRIFHSYNLALAAGLVAVIVIRLWSSYRSSSR